LGILRAQLADLAGGRPAANRVPLTIVQGEGGIDRLKADLRLAASLDELARDQLTAPAPAAWSAV
jgi:hypothetical protein